MYQDHFRLTTSPFSIAPDPRFLYMSARHREALAHLVFGVRGEGGFVLLTGEIGTGKTTLCRCLLDQIQDRCDVAFILNPKMDVRELLATICEEFHVPMPAGGLRVKPLVDAISGHLLKANAAGRRAVLIIDEAQNLESAVLEQLRLLTNLETNMRKLLQIILIGQPELQEMLARPELRQMAQRIVARYHLTRLSREEVAAYVRHRLRVAGTVVPLFPDNQIKRLHGLTQGIPRLINLICDRALLGAYVQGKHRVTGDTLRQAAREVLGPPADSGSWRRVGWRLSLVGAIGALAAGAYFALPRWFDAWPDLKLPLPSAVAASTVPDARQSARPAAPVEAVQAANVENAPRPAAGNLPATDKLGWPESAGPLALSEKTAFRDLFGLYGITFDVNAKVSPCAAAAASHMRCLPNSGGLSDLLRFDQPAMLLMDGERGKPRYHVVLTALDHSTATVLVAGRPLRVPVADIALAWSGNYVLLWRPPPGYKNPVSTGKNGPAASWLRKSLASIAQGTSGRPVGIGDSLDGQVKSFQLGEGIDADGIPGALTLIRLNMRMDKTMPRISLNGNREQDVLHP